MMMAKMKHKAGWAALAFSALLTACGGGSGGSGGTGNDGSTGNPQQTAAALQPLPGGSTYVGTVSFGDTVKIALDSPAKGQLTLSFVNSQFGLAGDVVGAYTQANGVLSVSGLTPANGATLSQAQAAALSLSLVVSTAANGPGMLSGTIAQVPNLLGSGTLAGQFALTNSGVTSVADLAGQYSLVSLTGDYSVDGVPTGAQNPVAGQANIDAAGAARFCFGQAYSASCTDVDDTPGATARVTDVASFTPDPDQTTYPGAFDMIVGGQTVGRAFVAVQGANKTLFIDRFGKSPEGTPRTGSMVMTTTQTLPTGAFDGTWSCAEPNTDDKNHLLGDIAVSTVQISGGTGAANGQPGYLSLTYNAAFDYAAASKSSANPSVASGIGGLIAGQISMPAGVAGLSFLPVGSAQMYFIDEPNGSGFFVQGLCTRSS
ncbi:hypothetical protein B0G62_106182 [Paraburkholderia eburnea]|uniref:Uncharacterized protein n=1 Tax=Paraburkholderia eburnea TaxID=1189126 RepID=A0A2S4MA79_9BURK|nr:hypothetical protein [Paraburkholderia eburnea]POR51648.1 hypothetical protein B0G62_106182 [Paraburkholderia eburnea]PRZ22679.1 hypothetical protein BX588_106182 [Paraburkholderia eburnea]